jgi:hypothetical protein
LRGDWGDYRLSGWKHRPDESAGETIPHLKRRIVYCLIRAHELERHDGTEPVSVANQTAAFEGFSHSLRSTWFSPRYLLSPRGREDTRSRRERTGQFFGEPVILSAYAESKARIGGCGHPAQTSTLGELRRRRGNLDIYHMRGN